MNKIKIIPLLCFFLLVSTFFALPKTKKIKKKDVACEQIVTTTQALPVHYKYAIFDVSRSFWDKSIFDLMQAYNKKKGVPFTAYLKMLKHGAAYLFGNFDLKNAFEDFLKYCQGMTEEEVKKYALQVWDQDCKNYILKGTVDLYNKCKQDGMKTILAEVCFKELYDNLTKQYPFDYVCCSQLEYKDGIVTGKLIGQPCSGTYKLEIIKDLVEKKLGGSLKEVVFYSNSHMDIPLLELVGKPVVVNPTSKLESHAKTKGWEILKFKEFLKS